MFISSKIFTVPLIIIFAWILFSVILLDNEKEAIVKEEQRISAKIDDIKNDNKLLDKFIKNFDSPSFVEREARRNFNYKATGEEVVFVHRDLSAIKPSSSEDFLHKYFNYKQWWSRLVNFKN